MTAHTTEEASLVHCIECGSALAHDQRYCLQCGRRRGPLPRYIAQLIGGILEQGRRVAPADRIEAAAPLFGSGRLDAWLGAPRAAAAAVIGMLGFGVVVGSLVSGSAASVLQPVLVAVSPPTHSAAPVASGTGGSGGSGSSGGSSSSGGGSTSPSSTASPIPASPASSSTTPASPAPSTLPPVKHVFMIMLSDEGYNEAFVHSVDDPYLAKTLVSQGELVQNYYGVTAGPLANEIGLISGQGPTPQTAADCPEYKNIVPGVADTKGQVLGLGCVYPKSTQTIADQLTAAHRTWKTYIQTAGAGQRAKPEICHPKLGSSDGFAPTAKDPYATWRNPFLYFHSLINASACPKANVGLGQLVKDLKAASTTPALSYIVPDVCDDGSDVPCSAGARSGMAAADAFLKTVVPKIERSPAYKDGGMIAITFDGAPQTGPYADSSSCCNNPKYPNLPSSNVVTGTGTTTTATPTPTTTTDTTTSTTPTTTSTTPTTTTSTPTTPASTGSGATGGGGQVGLLLISRYVRPGFPDVTDFFNHYSLLASLEDLFGLKRLGYASDQALPVFGNAVYTNYMPG